MFRLNSVSDGVCVRDIDVHTHVITKMFVNNDLLFSSSYDKDSVVSASSSTH